MAIVDRAFAQYASEDAVAKAGQSAFSGFKMGTEIANQQAEIDMKRELIDQKKQEIEDNKDKLINDALKTAFDSKSTPALQDFSLKKYEALSKKWGRVSEDYSYKNDDSLQLLLKEGTARQVAFKLIAAGSAAPELVRAVDNMSPDQISSFLQNYQKSQQNLATVSALNREKTASSSLKAVLDKGLKLADDPGLKAANPELAKKLTDSQMALDDPASYAQAVAEGSQYVSKYKAGRDDKSDELKQKAADAKAAQDAMRNMFAEKRLGLSEQRLAQGSDRIQNAELTKIDKSIEPIGKMVRQASTDIGLLTGPVTKQTFTEVVTNFTGMMANNKGTIPVSRERAVMESSFSDLSSIQQRINKITPEGLNEPVNPVEVKRLRDVIARVKEASGGYVTRDIIQRSKELVQRKVVTSDVAQNWVRSRFEQYGISKSSAASSDPKQAEATYNKLLNSKDAFTQYMIQNKGVSKEGAEAAYDSALRNAKMKAGIK